MGVILRDQLTLAAMGGKGCGSGEIIQICAKVERAEAVASDEAIDDIIEASDAVMVARGDLGVEIGDAELVGVQKKLISRRGRQKDAPK